jgi:SAM-dependent methyltransferase
MDKLNTKEHLDYINHQKEKTTNPNKIKKWLGEEWDIKLNGFKEIFSQYDGTFNKNGKCVGLGARTGQEIAALRELGYEDSIGVDLVPFDPYTIEGDFHNLPFENNSVSLVYSNAVDHVLNPKLWSQEIDRILIKGGYFLLNCQIDTPQDEYSVFEIENIKSDLIDKYFSDYKIIKNNSIPNNVHAMNWETLLQK